MWLFLSLLYSRQRVYRIHNSNSSLGTYILELTTNGVCARESVVSSVRLLAECNNAPEPRARVSTKYAAHSESCYGTMGLHAGVAEVGMLTDAEGRGETLNLNPKP